ncbi:MAG: hypothetical protein E7048_07085 [Lentisphaerae bacterium]|nr:hypothetical protein [Lentisphaerota bacterium]
MVQRLLVLFFLSGVLFFSGCSLLPEPVYAEPAYYDLCSLDEKIPVQAGVGLRSFSDKTGNGTRMVSRSDDKVRVFFDEFNRFSSAPAQLVKRRLAASFEPVKNKEEDNVTVSGDLLRFEILPGENKVRMVIDYQLHCGKKSRQVRYDLEEKMTTSGPAAAAAGFEKCIIRSGRQLAGEIAVLIKESVRVKK